MSEKFERVDVIENIYGDAIGQVELWDASFINKSFDNRYTAISKIATLSYGNDSSKNPKQLYENLLKSGHLSVFEFCVCNPLVGGKNEYPNLREYSYMPTGNSDRVNDYYALFKIKAPIFVVRQFVRHRNHTMLEMSRRYVKDAKRQFEFYEYEKDREFYDMCIDKYRSAMESGMLAQDARRYIPVSAYTEFWWMNTWRPIEGLRRLFELRLDDVHTQKETFLMVKSMSELIQKHQPKLHQIVHGYK